MDISTFTDANFEYANEKEIEYILSLNLKNYFGNDIDFSVPFIYVDHLLEVYFFKFITKYSINLADIRRREQEYLIKKYKEQAPYSRGISQYFLFIKNKPIYIFADCANYQDGVSVTLLEVIAEGFSSEDIPILKNIIKKGFYFNNKHVPEFSYQDHLSKFTFKKEISKKL